MSLKRKPICALLAVLFTGCASDLGQSPNTSGDFDPFADDEANLTAIQNATCTVTSTTGFATLDVSGGSANQTIILARRAADGALLVNGSASVCVGAVLGAGTVSTATGTTLKKLTFKGGSGNEKLILDYQNGALVNGITANEGINIDLGSGTDTLAIRGGAGNDNVVMGLAGTDYGIGIGVNLAVDANKDIVVKNGSVDSTVVALGDGNDTFIASGGTAGVTGVFGLPVTVYGGAGNDTFSQGTAATPSETLFGGTGTDTVTYAARTSTATTVSLTPAFPGPVDADDGDPTYNSNAGEDDDLHDDLEVVVGTSAADTMAGVAGLTVSSSAGAAVTIGPSGTPTASGMHIIVFTTAGARGTSAFKWSSDGGVTWTTGVTSAASHTLNGLTVTTSNSTAVLGETHVFWAGNWAGTTFTGGAGNDSLTGGGGNDTLNGDAGDDLFTENGTVPSGADVFNGGADTDTIDYSSRTAAVTIAIDATATSGEASEGDKIATDVENAKGGAGADTITGSSSNNVLYGGAGADTVSGGAGDDTFMNLCTTTDGDDTFSGGAGSDTFDYSSCVATNGALLAALSADGTSNGTGGLKDKDKNGTADDQEADVYYPDVENLTGGDGADSLTGSVYYSTSVTGANIIDGGAGNDTIDGLSGDDLIDGGAGTDVVDCGTGEGDSVMNAESTFMCEI